MALLQGVTNWLFRPAATADLSITPNAQRMGKYNEAAIVDYYGDQYPACLEGSYYVAATAAPFSTGVAMTSQQQAFASAATKPWSVIINMNLAGGPNIELDYIKMMQTAGQLPTTATSAQIAITLDTAATKMPTTAGTVLTPVNTNTAATTASKALVQVGAITTTTDSSAAVTVFQDYIQPIATTPVALAGDMYLAKFGTWGVPGSSVNYQLSGGTPTIVKQVVSVGPSIIIPPGWAACVKVWFPALGAVAPTYSMEVGWRER